MAGLTLALLCDLRIAAWSARLGDTSGRAGLLPDEGGAWLFPRVMGIAAATRMTLLSELYDASAAQQLGLVGEVVPDEQLHSRTMQLADELAARAPLAVRMAKRMMRRSLELTFEQSLGDAENAVNIINDSQDVQEGVAAFLEKRAPCSGGAECPGPRVRRPPRRRSGRAADLPPVAANLFASADGTPRLIGSACRACGTLAFPQQQSCPRCCGEDVAATLLPAEGTLWSWTVQRFPPKSPPYAGAEAAFRPYAVGYVALPGGIAVQGRLTGADAPDGYRIGMPMRLVLEPFLRRDGTTVAAYAFAPAREGADPAAPRRGERVIVTGAAWPSWASASTRSAGTRTCPGWRWAWLRPGRPWPTPG